MDYRAETELGSLCRDLVEDLERVRPGLPAEAGEAEIRAAAARRVEVRLQELYRERYDLGEDLGGAPAEGGAEGAQLALYRREVDQILLPRWAALAHRRNLAERAAAQGWRGAGAFNRGAWAFLFLLLGAFVVWAPFIPIWEKWIPFAAAAAAAAFAPVLPDLHGALGRRRHQLQLLTLLIDLDHAGRALPLAPAPRSLPASPAAARAEAPSRPVAENEKGPS